MRHALNRNSIWLLEPGAFETVHRLLREGPGRAAKEPPALSWKKSRSYASAVRAAGSKTNPASGGGRAADIAILPLLGPLEWQQSWLGAFLGGTGIEEWTWELNDAVNSSRVAAILIPVDSPGGEIIGIPETAKKIDQARKVKPVVAIVDGWCCSAAYWLACASGNIVALGSGQVGSIGCIMLHQEYSAMLESQGIQTSIIRQPLLKYGGNEYEPLAPAVREDMQQEVDEIYARFVSDVAKYRKVSPSSVASSFGRGLSMLASRGLAAGMVDSLGTFDETYLRMAKALQPQPASRTASPELRAAQARQAERRLRAALAPAAHDGPPTDVQALLARQAERRRSRSGTSASHSAEDEAERRREESRHLLRRRMGCTGGF